MSLLDLYNKVAAKPIKERNALLKAKYGTTRPKDVTRPKAGAIPDLLFDEVTIQSEWHISAELVEAMRRAERWSRESLELHIVQTTCQCCGNIATHSQGVYVRFRHKADVSAVRRINKDYRADPSDYLLPREKFIFSAFTQFCAECFTSSNAEIQAWEAQIHSEHEPLPQLNLPPVAPSESDADVTAIEVAFTRAKAVVKPASDDAAFDTLVSESSRPEPVAEDVSEQERDILECPKCESGRLVVPDGDSDAALYSYICDSCDYCETPEAPGEGV